MTTLFYAPPSHVREGRVTLPEDESHHAANVLRHREGDLIQVVDGEGSHYSVRLDAVSRTEVAGQVVQTRKDVGEPPYRLRLALAPLKSGSRFEVFVEKAVELGVSSIVPILTERTEKPHLKSERLARLTVAAMKQCGRSRLTVVEKEVAWSDLLRESREDRRLVCHEAALLEDQIMNKLAADRNSESILIAVGPEGGLSPQEIGAAISAGFDAVSLGPRRLRSETAAIAAATAVMFFFEAASA